MSRRPSRRRAREREARPRGPARPGVGAAGDGRGRGERERPARARGDIYGFIRLWFRHYRRAEVAGRDRRARPRGARGSRESERASSVKNNSGDRKVRKRGEGLSQYSVTTNFLGITQCAHYGASRERCTRTPQKTETLKCAVAFRFTGHKGPGPRPRSLVVFHRSPCMHSEILQHHLRRCHCCSDDEGQRRPPPIE